MDHPVLKFRHVSKLLTSLGTGSGTKKSLLNCIPGDHAGGLGGVEGQPAAGAPLVHVGVGDELEGNSMNVIIPFHIS